MNETSGADFRPYRVLSVWTILLLLLFLASCYLYQGWELVIPVSIGAIAGLIVAALSVASKDGGTFRVSLRVLVFVMVIVAVQLVFFLNRLPDQKVAVLAIEKIGGQVEFYQDPADKAKGEMRQVSAAQIIRKEIRPNDLRYLRSLKNLERLDLDYCQFGDKGLKHVGKLTQLEWLDLEDTAITNDGLRNLSRLKNLKELILDGNDIDDEGLMHLSKLKSLESVRVRQTRVTPQGAAEFNKKLPNCRVYGFATPPPVPKAQAPAKK